MSTYSLNVHIATDDLETLKGSGYKLCLAKKVNGIYTVVWSGDHQYLANNWFRWTEEYQVFGQNKFKVGALVEADTECQDIEFGQTCTIDAAGSMGEATGSTDDSGNFHVHNVHGKISVGVMCKLNDTYKPIFVSPTAVIGSTKFEPIVAVQVWFSSTMTTGTMIYEADSTAIQVKYHDNANKTIAYVNGKWISK